MTATPDAAAAAQSADPASRHVLWTYALVCSVYFVHAGFLTPYLPLWLKSQGQSLMTISVLATLPAFTRVFAPYLWGHWSDRQGQAAGLLQGGCGVALLASLGLWFALPTGVLACVLLAIFASTSGITPLSEAAFAHAASRPHQFDVSLFGRLRLLGSLAFLVTVFAAGALLERFGLQQFAMWITATLALLYVSSLWLPAAKQALTPHNGEVESVAPVMARPLVQWLFVSVFFHVLSHIAVGAFLSLYLDELGYGKTVIGLMWAASVLAEIAWFYWQGPVWRRLSPAAWLVACGGVMVLRTSLTAWGAAWWPVLLAAQCLHAITFAAHHSSCTAMVTRQFGGSLKGRGQALYTVLGYGLPGAMGGILGGYFGQKYGLSLVFIATIATSIVATACALRVWQLQTQAGAAKV